MASPFMKSKSTVGQQQPSAPSAVFHEAVQGVLDAKMPKALTGALRPLYALVSSGKYSVQEMIQAGVADACVHAVTLEKGQTAILVLYVLCTGEHRVAVYNVPNFRSVISAKAIEGNENALGIMWNASDCEALAHSIATIPNFIDAMLKIMKDPKATTRQRDSALSIIRNLTMFRDAQPILLQHPTIIDDLLQMTLSSNEYWAAKATMGVANLVGKDEVRSELLRKAKSNTLNNIVNILADSLGPRSMSYALYEPLLSLHYLSIPKQNRDVLRRTLMPLLPVALSKALSTNDVVSMEHVIAILAQFAFDPESVRELKSNEELITNLEMVIAHGKSTSDWATVGRDAQGLLWTLKGAGDTIVTGAIRTNQVMISYSWAQKPIAIRVHNYLTNAGFKVWRDDDQIKANFMDAMAEAVMAYKESANCKREITFAANKEKKIVPLLVEDGYTGDGWLGLLIAPIMYYDLTRNFETGMEQVLAKELNHDSTSLPLVNGGGRTSARSAKPALNTVQDVADFLRSQAGLEDLVDTFVHHEIDGHALRAMLKWWSNGSLHFNEIKEWFGIKTVGKLFKLRAALESVSH